MPTNGHAPGSGNPTYTQQSHHQAYVQSHTVLYNPEIPHPIRYSTPDQQGSTMYVPPPSMHHTMTTQILNTIQDALHSQRQHRLASTSEDKDDTYNNSNDEWQVVRGTKRKKSTAHHSTPQTP
jgi:hypothetical protein